VFNCVFYKKLNSSVPLSLRLTRGQLKGFPGKQKCLHFELKLQNTPEQTLWCRKTAVFYKHQIIFFKNPLNSHHFGLCCRWASQSRYQAFQKWRSMVLLEKELLSEGCRWWKVFRPRKHQEQMWRGQDFQIVCVSCNRTQRSRAKARLYADKYRGQLFISHPPIRYDTF